MRAVEWGSDNWGRPGFNVHESSSGSELDAEARSDQ